MPRQADGQRRFADRLSPLIAAAGVVPVPALLVRHQARLGLTAPELVYLLHVLSHRWDGSQWPWVALSSVCEATGASERSVQEWKASLQRKHLLRCKPRYLEGIGRRADEHDLSGLFAALEALALEEETRKAVESARADLPQPTYHSGLSSTPQLQTGRPAIRRRTAVRKVAPPPRDNSHRGGAADRTAPARDVASEEEPRTRRPSHRTGTREPYSEKSAQGSRAAAAARPVRRDDDRSIEIGDPSGVEEHRPLNESDRAALRAQLAAPGQRDVPPPAADGDNAAPTWYDEGILDYVERYAELFGDNDPARSIEVAHHLWWNAGLSRSAMHNAMKKAYYATRRVQEAGQIRGTPMAYYFTLLKAAIDDELIRCQKAV
jgi:hypothetical protein